MILRVVFRSTLLLLLLPVFALTQDKASTESPPWPILNTTSDQTPLPGTSKLEDDSDFADRILTGADAFLLKKIEASRSGRKPTREKLAEILGINADARFPNPVIEYIGPSPAPLLDRSSYRVSAVRWRAFRDVYGMGLLFEPPKDIHASVVLIPDADNEFQADRIFDRARELAGNSGCRVLVPTLIPRSENEYAMTTREYLHRSAYELGRTLVGYELHMALTGLDAVSGEKSQLAGIAGTGEGGRIALYAGALQANDLAAVFVEGYFAPREEVWNEPADRNVFGLLNHFGDAEIASLIDPGKLTLSHKNNPTFVYRPDENGEPEIALKYTGKKGKPGKLIVPTKEQFDQERNRILITGKPNESQPSSSGWDQFHLHLTGNSASSAVIDKLPNDNAQLQAVQQSQQKELADAINRHNQWALIDSRRVRVEFMSKLNTKEDLKAYEKTAESYRTIFREDVVGHFDDELLPLNPRSRKYQEGEGVVSYEVVLDTFPGLIAYGVLTVPDNLPLDGSKKLPVVVCQHGLEGRPQDVISEEKYKAYKAFATRLAQRGYITFAPQNLYIKFDRFRTLQFKANAVGKTLFSLMVPQHQQITKWLAEQSWVEADKIGFYGLSYGGKSAMRIPALVDRYALSICSADFNEWVWKNAATDPKSLRYSYANKGEYEIFEWNLGGTFNYAEMAALICPRPFMVERGHFDGVGPDEAVAYEFAKVRNLYAAQLGIPERTTIEWFAGPHSINGVETYAFLDRWLKGK